MVRGSATEHSKNVLHTCLTCSPAFSFPSWHIKITLLIIFRAAPNELEYLDVFDFFNVPRLPVAPGGEVGHESGNGTGDLHLPELNGFK
jgi:hypothetical protein